MNESIDVELVSGLAVTLPFLLGGFRSNVLVAVGQNPNCLTWAVETSLDGLDDDQTRLLRFARTVLDRAKRQPATVHLLGISESTQTAGTLHAARRLLLAIDVPVIAHVGISSYTLYSPDGVRGPDLPLVQVPALEVPHDTITRRHNNVLSVYR